MHITKVRLLPFSRVPPPSVYAHFFLIFFSSLSSHSLYFFLSRQYLLYLVYATQVRSTNLDTWEKHRIESMVKWGNNRSNAMWEVRIISYHKSRNNSTKPQWPWVWSNVVGGEVAQTAWRCEPVKAERNATLCILPTQQCIVLETRSCARAPSLYRLARSLSLLYHRR